MDRSQLTGRAAFALTVASWFCLAPASLAQLVESKSEFPDAPPPAFRLHVVQVGEPEIVVTKNYKPVPSVDSRLVQQIHEVRMSLPCWQGIHHLPPGTGGTGR